MRKLLFFLSVFLIFFSAFGDGKKLGYGDWDAWMLGIDTPQKMEQIRNSCLKMVKVAFVGTIGLNDANLSSMIKAGACKVVYKRGSAETAKSKHDDYQVYEILNLTNRLGLNLEIHIWQALNNDLAECFDLAANEADLVVTYHSFWGRNTVSKIVKSMAKHPEILYLSPYGEIAGAPPTSTSMQANGLKRGESVLENLVTTIPLSRNDKGAILHPTCRNEKDTEAITFVTPSSYARNKGATCPSVGMTVAVASYIIASCMVRPEAAEIVRLIAENVSVPEERMLALVDFDTAAVAQFRADLEVMSKPDKIGLIRLYAPGLVDLWNVYLAINK